MTTNSEDPASCSATNSDGATLPPGWFSIAQCGSVVQLHPLPELLDIDELGRLIACGGFCCVFLLGTTPRNFPKQAGTALAIAVYNWLKSRYTGKLCFPREFETRLNFGRIVSVPGHIQDACQQLRDFVGGIKKSEKVTDRLKRDEQPTPEELAESMLPPQNDAKKEVLAKMLEAIRPKDSRIMEFLSYFLRLAVINYRQLCTHYKAQHEQLLGWACLLERDSFWPTKLDLVNQAKVVEQLQAIRPSLTRYVAEVLCQQGERSPTYQLLKRWFVSRYEEFGLTLFSYINECHYYLKMPDVELFFAARRADYDTIWAVAAAWILYAGKKNSKSYNEDVLVRLPDKSLNDLSDNDRKVGRFARCFSGKFLSWCTFHNDLVVTARIIGFACGLRRLPEVPEEVAKMESFRIGYRAGIKLYDVQVELDDVMSSLLREVEKKMKAKRKCEVCVSKRGKQPGSSSAAAAEEKVKIPEAIEWPDREYEEATIREMVKELEEKLRPDRMEEKAKFKKMWEELDEALGKNRQ